MTPFELCTANAAIVAPMLHIQCMRRYPAAETCIQLFLLNNIGLPPASLIHRRTVPRIIQCREFTGGWIRNFLKWAEPGNLRMEVPMQWSPLVKAKAPVGVVLQKLKQKDKISVQFLSSIFDDQ